MLLSHHVIQPSASRNANSRQIVAGGENLTSAALGHQCGPERIWPRDAAPGSTNSLSEIMTALCKILDCFRKYHFGGPANNRNLGSQSSAPEMKPLKRKIETLEETLLRSH